MDSESKLALAKLWHTAPLIAITTLLNSIIAFLIGWQVLEIFILGLDEQHPTLTLFNKVMVLLIAIVTYLYLHMLPKIRDYISSRSKNI